MRIVARRLALTFERVTEYLRATNLASLDELTLDRYRRRLHKLKHSVNTILVSSRLPHVDRWRRTLGYACRTIFTLCRSAFRAAITSVTWLGNCIAPEKCCLDSVFPVISSRHCIDTDGLAQFHAVWRSILLPASTGMLHINEPCMTLLLRTIGAVAACIMRRWRVCSRLQSLALLAVHQMDYLYAYSPPLYVLISYSSSRNVCRP